MSGCATARWVQFIGKVQTAAGNALYYVLRSALPGELEEDDTGGYFCLKVIDADGFLVRPYLIGQVPDTIKAHNYRAYCQEKALRLEYHRIEDGKSVSSFESRNESEGKWPGAIVGTDDQGRDYAFSFSGLPWKFDEAVTLMTAILVGHLTKEQAVAIAQISGNEVFIRIAEGIQ